MFTLFQNNGCFCICHGRDNLYVEIHILLGDEGVVEGFPSGEDGVAVENDVDGM